MRLRVVLGYVALTAALLGCRAHGAPDTSVILPQKEPVQAPIGADALSNITLHVRQDVYATPKASYRIAARVLSTERYYFGWQADLSPIDLALGWGLMSDPSVDRYISWHQGGRWYFYDWGSDSPYGTDTISPASSNVHIVPASTNLKRALFSLSHDDIIRLEGWLIDVDGPSGGRWTSSLSRTDTGSNACELMYVTALTTHGLTYR